MASVCLNPILPAFFPFADLPVGAEREQRPGVAIHVVFQVKHFRKTGAGRLVLGPRAVEILRAAEILDAAFEDGIFGIVERAQTHDGPRGLRRGAGALPFENRVVVGVATFAPAAVFALDAFEPRFAA